MENNDQVSDGPLSNGQVLAVAGGGSVLAAAVIAGLGRIRQARNQPSRREAVRDALIDARERNAYLAQERVSEFANRANKNATKRLANASRVVSTIPASVNAGGDDVRDLAGVARDSAAARLFQAKELAARSGQDSSDLINERVAATKKRARQRRHDAPRIDTKQTQKQAEALADMASKSLKSARKNVAPAVETARERAPILAGMAAGSANDRIHQIAEYAAEFAGNARERAEHADLSGITSAARPATETVRETFNRIKEDVTPVARDAVVQAAAAAIQLWEVTREQTADLDSKDLQKASSQLFSDLTHRAKEASAAVASTATSVTHDATGDLAERTEEARERAEEFTRRAASATAETSKDATSTLVWAGIAGGLVYYGLLNDQQRSRVDSAARSIYAGVTELVRDIQGYDADF